MYIIYCNINNNNIPTRKMQHYIILLHYYYYNQYYSLRVRVSLCLQRRPFEEYYIYV